MKQLSGSDALFLSQEKENQFIHIGALAIYDPSTAPGGFVRFKQILDFLTQGLNGSPIFRRRLVHAPLNLDRPYWIDEASIDIEFHVRHIALPKPGDWRQLMIQVARLHSRPLDLTKPAWEAWVIEDLDHIPGVPPGSFAMLLKFHHAAIDGESGAALLGSLHSLKAAGHGLPAKATISFSDREPSALELAARMVGNRVGQAADLAKFMLEATPMALTMGLTMGRDKLQSLLGKHPAEIDKTLATRPEPASKQTPRTRFNGKLSPHRVVETLPLPLADLEPMRLLAPGATLNDVFMSICSGAVRHYLAAKNELPKQTLNALMPISTRGADKGGDVGNQIGLAPVPVFTQIADPVERLNLIHQQTTRNKGTANPLKQAIEARLSNLMPARLAGFLAHKTLLPQVNFTISNVRGPKVPLYMAGARLQTFIPINMLLDGLGLSITGFSYNQVLWVCAVADRVMLPDPALFAQCLQTSVDEHKSAAAGNAKRAPKTRPTR